MKDEVEKLIREWLNSHNLQHIYLDKKFKADLKNAQQTAQVEAVNKHISRSGIILSKGQSAQQLVDDINAYNKKVFEANLEDGETK